MALEENKLDVEMPLLTEFEYHGINTACTIHIPIYYDTDVVLLNQVAVYSPIGTQTQRYATVLIERCRGLINSLISRGVFVPHLGYIFQCETRQDNNLDVRYSSGGYIFVAVCDTELNVVEGPLVYIRNMSV